MTTAKTRAVRGDGASGAGRPRSRPRSGAAFFVIEEALLVSAVLSFAELKLDDDLLYQRLYEINLHGANAVLYSSSSHADSCQKKMKVNLH